MPESSNIKISKCLGVNLRTVQRIQKEFNEFYSNYEYMIDQEPQFDDHSGKKRSRL